MEMRAIAQHDGREAEVASCELQMRRLQLNIARIQELIEDEPDGS